MFVAKGEIGMGRESVLLRLDKLLADSGKYSRKEAKGLIRAGRVQVDGKRAVSGEQKVGRETVVTVDGKAIRNQVFLYIMMNKPKGVVSATRDKTVKTVLDLLPESLRRPGLFPAGRLDKDTEGFMLITDDGGFAHRILAPRSHVPKTYHARLDGPVEMCELTETFAAGVTLEDGTLCAPAQVRLLEDSAQPLLEIVITQGMYHQIKRMVQVFSREVIWLKRVKIGELALDETLLSGRARELTPEELVQIR